MLRPLTILPRRDREEVWNRNNPVLKPYEIAVVYTSSGTKYKIGDGILDYKRLRFTTLEDVIENGVMYTPSRAIRVRGFASEWNQEGERNENSERA